ncbi:hypothetical protein Taro_009957 [Colocasia esculenta]|uniref:FAD-binding PCMH-type domain-containing protein n=1 Tax=Colocasia esculenta TaxID=4460 RepID=A0A843U6E2_COLES|nr:hypothetical protein [Colocasia esculenta]
MENVFGRHFLTLESYSVPTAPYFPQNLHEGAAYETPSSSSVDLRNRLRAPDGTRRNVNGGDSSTSSPAGNPHALTTLIPGSNLKKCTGHNARTRDGLHLSAFAPMVGLRPSGASLRRWRVQQASAAAAAAAQSRGSVNHYKTAIFSGTYRRSFVSAAVNFPRSPTFSKLTKDDIDHFKNILGDKYVIQEEDRLSTANLDWMRKYRGSSQLLLLPRSTKEVSQILHYCNSRCLAVVPQGGNTSLVGGSVPVYDEVIVNVGSMDKIVSFDKDNWIT